jgi:hypothetical protein
MNGPSSIFELRTITLGFASWLVPFAISMLFFDRTGSLAIPEPLFKSAMVVLSGGVGAVLLVLAFRRTAPTIANGAALGLTWLTINLALDLIVLVPLTGLTMRSYLFDIGLRYLLIPITAAAMGAVGSSGGVRTEKTDQDDLR